MNLNEQNPGQLTKNNLKMKSDSKTNLQSVGEYAL